MAIVLKRQKPMGAAAIAWWPGGLQMPKATGALGLSMLPSTVASTSAMAAPAACREVSPAQVRHLRTSWENRRSMASIAV